MPEQFELGQKLERARQAKELLENPLLMELLGSIKQKAIDEWKRTDWNETDRREKCYLAVLACEELEMSLASLVKEADYEAHIYKLDQAGVLLPSEERSKSC